MLLCYTRWWTKWGNILKTIAPLHFASRYIIIMLPEYESLNNIFRKAKKKKKQISDFRHYKLQSFFIAITKILNFAVICKGILFWCFFFLFRMEHLFCVKLLLSTVSDFSHFWSLLLTVLTIDIRHVNLFGHFEKLSTSRNIGLWE